MTQISSLPVCLLHCNCCIELAPDTPWFDAYERICVQLFKYDSRIHCIMLRYVDGCAARTVPYRTVLYRTAPHRRRATESVTKSASTKWKQVVTSGNV